MSIVEAITPFMGKMKQEITSFEECPGNASEIATRLNSIIALAEIAKKTLVKKIDEGTDELAELDRQIKTLMRIKGVPETEKVIDGLIKKCAEVRSHLCLPARPLYGEEASEASSKQDTLRKELKHVEKEMRSLANEDPCSILINQRMERRECILTELGFPCTSFNFHIKPKAAAGGAGKPDAPEKKPKHIVPCKKGKDCTYGRSCTFRHTKEELDGFKAKTGDKK